MGWWRKKPEKKMGGIREVDGRYNRRNTFVIRMKFGLMTEEIILSAYCQMIINDINWRSIK